MRTTLRLSKDLLILLKRFYPFRLPFFPNHHFIILRKVQQQEKETSKIYEDAETALRQEREQLQEKVFLEFYCISSSQKMSLKLLGNSLED